MAFDGDGDVGEEDVLHRALGREAGGVGVNGGELGRVREKGGLEGRGRRGKGGRKGGHEAREAWKRARRGERRGEGGAMRSDERERVEWKWRGNRRGVVVVVVVVGGWTADTDGLRWASDV